MCPEMSDFPDFNLNYEGLFGLDDNNGQCSDPELEETIVGNGEKDEAEVLLNETLTEIEFDPVGR